jgi:transposase
MENWSEIRRRVLVEGVSRRQILRETGMHWRTLRKMLKHSESPGYQQSKPRTKKKLEAYVRRIEQILKEDQALPRKQRHTAKRIWERLRAEGFTGGYTVVKDSVREMTSHRQEGFVPLIHRPGEAQVDFGQALVKMNGVAGQIHAVELFCAGAAGAGFDGTQ